MTLNKIFYKDTTQSHHPKTLLHYITEGIDIDGKNYVIVKYISDGGKLKLILRDDETHEYYEHIINTSVSNTSTDNSSVYDDSEIRSKLTALENKVDKDTVYDDSDVKSRLTALETKADKDTVYDDSDVKSRLTALETKADKDTVYDDTDVKSRLTALETKADKDTVYDDTDVKSRLTALENRVDNDTVYDDTDLRSKVTALENRVDNDTVYDDTEVKSRLTALESVPTSAITEKVINMNSNYTVNTDNPDRYKIYLNSKTGQFHIHLDFTPRVTTAGVIGSVDRLTVIGLPEHQIFIGNNDYYIYLDQRGNIRTNGLPMRRIVVNISGWYRQ